MGRSGNVSAFEVVTQRVMHLHVGGGTFLEGPVFDRGEPRGKILGYVIRRHGGLIHPLHVTVRDTVAPER